MEQDMTKYSQHFAGKTPLIYETAHEVGFYEGPFNGFNNYSAHAVELWGRVFMTSEHAYHWAKFPGKDTIQNEIACARSADASKQLAKKYKDLVRFDWSIVRRDVMKEIITAKRDQHADVRKQLVQTGSRTIIENSPRDSYWGIGYDRKGLNVLGCLWMELRDES